MSGTVKKYIDQIIAARSHGEAVLASTTRTKLRLKGVDPDKFTPQTPDDNAMIAKVRAIATEMSVTLH
jgi:hypothetical protein